MGYDARLEGDMLTDGIERIIQEIVPGKQITLAHVIANPDAVLYQKLGLDPTMDYAKSAIGRHCNQGFRDRNRLCRQI